MGPRAREYCSPSTSSESPPLSIAFPLQVGRVRSFGCIVPGGQLRPGVRDVPLGGEPWRAARVCANRFWVIEGCFKASGMTLQVVADGILRLVDRFWTGADQDKVKGGEMDCYGLSTRMGLIDRPVNNSKRAGLAGCLILRDSILANVNSARFDSGVLIRRIWEGYLTLLTIRLDRLAEVPEEWHA